MLSLPNRVGSVCWSCGSVQAGVARATQAFGVLKTLLLRFRTAGMRFQNKTRKGKWRYLLLTYLVMFDFLFEMVQSWDVSHVHVMSFDLVISIWYFFTSTSRSEVREWGTVWFPMGWIFQPPTWKLVGWIFSSWKLWQLGENIFDIPRPIKQWKRKNKKVLSLDFQVINLLQ